MADASPWPSHLAITRAQVEAAGYVILPRSVAEDAENVIESAQAQWGDNYLWSKWGHDEEAPRALAGLRAALGRAT